VLHAIFFATYAAQISKYSENAVIYVFYLNFVRAKQYQIYFV